MYHKAKQHLIDTTRGSAMLAVMIYLVVISVMTGSLLVYSTSEYRMNEVHKLRMSALNASEAVVEYGFADLASRFNRKTSFPLDELSKSNNPLELDSLFHDTFSMDAVLPADMELHGGVIPPGEWVFINPEDPANENDKLKGKLVFVREVEVYGKATAKHDVGFESNAYTMQKLSVRDAPLFAHAIFYNMDLEFHNGPKMVVDGPVHSNKDIWYNSGSGLDFTDTISAAGEIKPGLKFKNSLSSKHRGNVRLKDGSGKYQNLIIDTGNKGSMDSWAGDHLEDWKEFATQRWDGNLQSKVHGTPTINPVDMDPYVEDDPSTPSIDETENHGYAIIEPLLPSSHPNVKSEGVRNEKFAYKAGLILRVEANSSYVHGTSAPNEFYEMKAYKYQRSNPSDPLSAPVTDLNGDPVLVPVVLPPNVIGDVNADFDDLDSSPKAHPEGYSKPGSHVEGGMYDHRQDIALDTYTLNVKELTNLINNKDNTATGFNGTYDVDKDWNGTVYIEFPTSTTVKPDFTFDHGQSNRPDNIVKGAIPNLALNIIEAKEIPSPAGTNNPGLSIATNGPVYTIGHVNADGNFSTGGASAIDSANEKPMSISGDTFTILSENWIDRRKYSAENSTSNRPATNTEVSAAVLTGLMPSKLGDTSSGSSGGVHNFPRFLEKWSSRTLRLRSSLVAMFQSEVHTKPMPNDYGKYYSPPNRNFGFNDNFRNGNYPPGTPNARNFRRSDFRDLTKEEYEQAISGLWDGV